MHLGLIRPNCAIGHFTVLFQTNSKVHKRSLYQNKSFRVSFFGKIMQVDEKNDFLYFSKFLKNFQNFQNFQKFDISIFLFNKKPLLLPH